MPIGNKYFRIPKTRARKRLKGKKLDAYVEWHAKFDELGKDTSWETDIFENFDDCGRGVGDLAVYREDPEPPVYTWPLREIPVYRMGHHIPPADPDSILTNEEDLLLIKEEEELKAAKKRVRHVAPLPDRPAKQARMG